MTAAAGSAPKVSVIVPVYNSRERVCRTVDSILAQTMRDFELIVIDDGSTDGSGDVLRERYGDGIRLHRRENGGIARAKNSGLDLARGEYIAFCDHDDLWMPEKLRLQIDAMDQDSRVGLSYTRYALFDDRDRDFAQRPRQGFNGDIFIEMVRKVFVLTSSTVVRRAVIDRVGTFDPRFTLADDLDFYMRVARVTRARYHDDVLVRYFVHDNNTSRRKNSDRKYTEETLDVYSAWLRRPESTPEERHALRRRVGKYHYNMARFALKDGKRRVALDHARTALALRPASMRFMSKWLHAHLPKRLAGATQKMKR